MGVLAQALNSVEMREAFADVLRRMVVAMVFSVARD